MIDQLVGGLSLIVIGFGILYCFGAILAGLLEFRSNQRRIGDQTGDGYDQPPAPRHATAAPVPYHVYALIAALDEEAVIGATVRGLLAQSPDLRIVLVDDASSDRTAHIATAAGGDRIRIVTRTLPHARQGKGQALNAGFTHLVADVRERRLDPDRVLVCVMDADGRLSPDAVHVVTACFDDERVGGVQLPVRIRNRNSLLTFMQDFEFWGVSAIAQVGRVRTGTVSLGGNGQFTRLSALLGLGRPPWSNSLTEDLDLTISLLLEGWRLTSSVDVSVGQQGVKSLQQLIRQRTRWFQGHMGCGRRLPEIWASRRMSHAAVLELSLYLAVPWLLVLPWSVFFHLGLLEMARNLLAGGSAFAGNGWASVARGFAWYVVSFAPSFVFGAIYRRRCREVGLLRALLLAHLLLGMAYVSYLATWTALRRVLRGENWWDKTRRVTELDNVVPLPIDPRAAHSEAATAG